MVVTLWKKYESESWHFNFGVVCSVVQLCSAASIRICNSQVDVKVQRSDMFVFSPSIMRPPTCDPVTRRRGQPRDLRCKNSVPRSAPSWEKLLTVTHYLVGHRSIWRGHWENSFWDARSTGTMLARVKNHSFPCSPCATRFWPSCRSRVGIKAPQIFRRVEIRTL